MRPLVLMTRGWRAEEAKRKYPQVYPETSIDHFLFMYASSSTAAASAVDQQRQQQHALHTSHCKRTRKYPEIP